MALKNTLFHSLSCTLTTIRPRLSEITSARVPRAIHFSSDTQNGRASAMKPLNAPASGAGGRGVAVFWSVATACLLNAHGRPVAAVRQQGFYAGRTGFQ